MTASSRRSILMALPMSLGWHGKVAAVGAKIEVWIFLAVDCPISNRYVPVLKRLAEEFRPRGVEFQGMFSVRGTTAAAIAEWEREYAPGFRLELDEKRRKMRQVKATRAPEAVVLRNGRIVYRGRIDNRVQALGREMSIATQHDLQDAIEAALEGRAVRQPWPASIGCYL